MMPIDQCVLKEVTFMWFIGIDWAEKYLDFCIENNNGDIILRGRVDNDDDGFNSMLNLFLQSNVSLAEVAVSIESPHQRVVDFLLARSVSVYPVNPTAVHEYRKSRKISGSKSDTADAELLSDYLREQYEHLRVWHLYEPELRRASYLVSCVPKPFMNFYIDIVSLLLCYFCSDDFSRLESD
jgi:hypothetical protein